MSVVVRSATHADVDSVLEVWKEAAGPTALVDDVEAVRRLLVAADGSLLLAHDNGRVVGTIIAGWDGWRGNLYRLAVLPARRSEGIGRRLVTEAEAALKGAGCQRVTALVHLELGDAAAFWDKVGYEHDSEVGRFVRNL